MRRVLALLALLLVTSCAPIAEWAAGAIVNGDATLSWGVGSLTFTPDQPSRGVVLTLDGLTLTLTEIPAGVNCTVTATTADCRLGSVSEPVTIGLTGTSILAFATYRTTGPTVYRTFAPFGGD